MDWTLEDNGADDYINVEDVCKRVEELQSLQEDATDAEDEYNRASFEDKADALDVLQRAQDAFSEPEQAELESLLELLRDLRDYGGDHKWNGDWYPGMLIDEEIFEQYAEQMAEDIGAIDRDAKWPYTCIDWEKAANELRVDYSEINVNGRPYLYR